MRPCLERCGADLRHSGQQLMTQTLRSILSILGWKKRIRFGRTRRDALNQVVELEIWVPVLRRWRCGTPPLSPASEPGGSEFGVGLTCIIVPELGTA